MAEGMERRQFLRTAAIAGAAAAGVGLLGCSSSGGGDTTYKWDKEADVVIVGGGGTGLAAAIEAADAGASVLILEKAAKTGGTTSLSGGVIQASATPYQKEFTQYQDDTPEKHAQTWIVEGEGLVDEALVKDLANGMPGNIEWLTGLGLKFNAVYGHCHVPYLDDAGVFADRIHVYEGGGGALGGTVQTDALRKAVDERGVTVELNTQVTKLIRDPEKGVIGVEAKSGESTFLVKAKKGVVVATASVDRDNELAKAFNGQQYWDNTTQLVLVAQEATGDGIRMGLEIGAAMAGMHGTIDFCGVTGIGTNNQVPQPACIFVNGQGQRFVCEDSTYAYHFRAIYNQNMMHQKPTYMIIDTPGLATTPWGGDKLAEALSAGTLVEGATIAELAGKIDVPADNLVATLDRWNAMIAKSGADTDYRRNTQLVPINTGPFYAYKQVSFNLGSIGGFKIDVDCHCYDTAGNVIPHLFAGGLAAGDWIGPYYPGSGTAVGGTVHWGRKCGKSAAAETAWE